jgi:hypothetical protein
VPVFPLAIIINGVISVIWIRRIGIIGVIRIEAVKSEIRIIPAIIKRIVEIGLIKWIIIAVRIIKIAIKRVSKPKPYRKADSAPVKRMIRI